VLRLYLRFCDIRDLGEIYLYKSHLGVSHVMRYISETRRRRNNASDKSRIMSDVRLLFFLFLRFVQLPDGYYFHVTESSIIRGLIV
jgi:hypothetical protein